MAAFIAKFVGKKILAESIENKFGKEDPYFESIPATRLDGRPSKSKAKKRRKALPPGLSDHDAKVLTKVKRRAYRLDMCLFSFLGVRFGWGAVIGFVPGIGDAIDAFLALMVMKTCMTVDGGLPSGLKINMILNIFFDFVIGLVPFLGDMADAMFRANTRNVILLEEHLRQKGVKDLHQHGLPVPAIDPSDPTEFDRMEANLGQNARSRPNSQESSPHRTPQQASSQQIPRPPNAAEVRQSRSWFGRQTERPRDVEMGQVEGTRSDSRRQRRQNSRHSARR